MHTCCPRRLTRRMTKDTSELEAVRTALLITVRWRAALRITMAMQYLSKRMSLTCGRTLRSTFHRGADKRLHRTIMTSSMWLSTRGKALSTVKVVLLHLDAFTVPVRRQMRCLQSTELIEPCVITSRWSLMRLLCQSSRRVWLIQIFWQRKVVRGSERMKRYRDRSKLNGCKVSRVDREFQVL